MRLIDADAFNNPEVLAKLRTAEFDDEIQDIIKSIPTVQERIQQNEMQAKSSDRSSGIL